MISSPLSLSGWNRAFLNSYPKMVFCIQRYGFEMNNRGLARVQHQLVYHYLFYFVTVNFSNSQFVSRNLQDDRKICSRTNHMQFTLFEVYFWQNFSISIYVLVNKNRASEMVFLVLRDFFTWFLISKMAEKINLRITTKSHAADSEIGFLAKSISKSNGCATAMPTAWDLTSTF